MHSQNIRPSPNDFGAVHSLVVTLAFLLLIHLPDLTHEKNQYPLLDFPTGLAGG